MLVDEKAALEVAEKYRSEKQAAQVVFDDDDLLDEFASRGEAGDDGIAAPMEGDALAPQTLTDAEIDAAWGMTRLAIWMMRQKPRPGVLPA